MYYLRTRAAADAIKFTVDQQALARRKAARAATSASPDVEPLKVRPTCCRSYRGCNVFDLSGMRM